MCEIREVDSMDLWVESMQDELAKLKAENERLRAHIFELARRFEPAWKEGKDQGLRLKFLEAENVQLKAERDWLKAKLDAVPSGEQERGG